MEDYKTFSSSSSPAMSLIRGQQLILWRLHKDSDTTRSMKGSGLGILRPDLNPSCAFCKLCDLEQEKNL